MKYFVTDACIGCGLCAGMCPEVFEMTDSGLAMASPEDIPADMEAVAEDAMNACPTSAIEPA